MSYFKKTNVIRIIKYIIDSKIYISLIAVGMVFRTDQIFHLSLSYSTYFIVFFSTLLVYSYHSLGLKISFASRSTTREISKINYFIFSIVIGLLFLVVLFTIYPKNLILLSPATLLTAYYFTDEVNLGGFKFAKRYFKTIILTSVWLFVTSIFPFLSNGGNNFSTDFMSYITVEAIFIYIICFLFEHRDNKSDPQQYLILNPHKNPLLVFVGAISFILFAIYFSWLNGVNQNYLVLKLFLVIFLILTYRISIRSKSELWFYFILDGLLAIDIFFLYTLGLVN